MRMEFALPPTIRDRVVNNHNGSKREQREALRYELDIALLAKATERAFVSAFQFATDFPIGAVAADINNIAGCYAAADVRYDSRYHLHAEMLALAEAKLHGHLRPDTLAVTVEPCGTCIEQLEHSGIDRVVFAVPRYRLSDLGLVNERPGIFTRDGDRGLPFEIVQIGDPEINELNMMLFRNIKRDPSVGKVQYDLDELERELRTSDQTAIDTSFLAIPPAIRDQYKGIFPIE